VNHDKFQEVVNMKKLQVVFTSKPFDLEEVLYWQQSGIRPERVEIAETVRLSPTPMMS